MNEGFENNLTQLNDNWMLYNSSLESVIPRSNITYVGFYLHQPYTAAIFIVSYLLIFLVCMVGNGVVCFIVLRSKNMRTVTNLFILNLAVSDLLVGIFCMPTTLLDNIITGEQTVIEVCCSFVLSVATLPKNYLVKLHQIWEVEHGVGKKLLPFSTEEFLHVDSYKLDDLLLLASW